MSIDLRSHFKHLHWRKMGHSLGVDVASDFADKTDDDPVFGIFKNCGLWTMDEADLLYRCAKQVAPGAALDIGAHTGWTAAHMAAAGLDIVAVDPMLKFQGFQDRFEENMRTWWGRVCRTSYLTSDAYFAELERMRDPRRDPVLFNLITVDGEHDPPFPLHDAKNAAAHLAPNGVILFHDAMGRPVIDAINWLTSNGFSCSMYTTVHCVGVCYRGSFVPPILNPDPLVIVQDLPSRMDGLNKEKVTWNGVVG